MEEAAVTDGPVAPASALTRQQRERRFYSWMALALVAVIVVGFAPTFYLKPFNIIHFPRPAPDLNPRLMTHGLLFSLWMLIFIVQTQLVAANRRDLHRKLGVAGFSLGVVMLPIMYISMIDQIGRNTSPPFIDVYGFSVVPLFPIPFYALMLWWGWNARRADLQSHKRLMLSYMIMLAQPAVTRLPLTPPTLIGFQGLGVACLLLFVPLIIWDLRSTGKVHPATIKGIAVYGAILAGQTYFLANPDPWRAFVVYLPGIA